MERKRPDHELSECVKEWGWRYHHIGIPTKEEKPNERYLSQFKLYVSGFETSPFGTEWMRYENDSPIDKLIQTVPHVAFEVDDLEKELRDHDFKIITKPNPPSKGVRVAMIEYDGVPIELIEFENK